MRTDPRPGINARASQKEPPEGDSKDRDQDCVGFTRRFRVARAFMPGRGWENVYAFFRHSSEQNTSAPAPFSAREAAT